MDFYIISKLLWRKKWYLILLPLLSVMSCYLLTMDMAPEFKSTAKLATGFTTNDRISITDERTNLREAEVKFRNLIETMTSEQILSMLSYRLILNDLNSAAPFRSPEMEGIQPFTPGETLEAIKIYTYKLDSFEILSNYNVKEKRLLELLTVYGYVNWIIEKNLKVQWVEGSDYVTVQSMTEDPFLSAHMANTLCEEIIRYDNYLRARQADQAVHFFANLVDEKKKILDEKTALLGSQQPTGASAYVGGKAETLSEISEYESKRSVLVSNIQRLTLSIENLDKRIKGIPNANRKYEAHANVIRIRRRLDDLYSEKAKSNDPAIEKEIKELSDQLKEALSTIEDSKQITSTPKEDLVTEKEKLEIELRVAKTDLAVTDGTLYRLRRSVSGTASREVETSSLQKEVDKASEDYLSALNRFNTERSKAMISSPLQLATMGQPNGHPEFPKRYLLLAFAGAVTFLVCVFVIVFSEYTDTRIKNPDQFKNKVGLNLAGTINRINTRNLNLDNLFLEKQTKDLERFKHFLRKLRVEIEASRGRVFLITSTKPSEGKTFVILCLSFLLAMLRKNVLIIDTNFRHNSLTQVLLKKIKKSTRLEQIIPSAQIVRRDQVASEYPNTFIQSITLSSAQPGVNLIGNTGCAASPSEIFADKDFGITIESLKEYYDYILIEGASLNNYSDTRELVEFVDKVIPVFSAESIIKAIDRESIDYLRSLDGKLMGAVLNRANIKDLDAY